ncbi:hypothetical protein BDQ94DRAFT_136550 [Aspergillus welwitschiae]|uniref:Uncharacterized protein n=1 Tax=Aspergillus welwitschiae TaxID=1341132 RepID=A0A3F3QE26_9EURO|nr:hypothetical protein BDQ94DRAFT_136550 [Aspergillus welwitschiae]RDH37501.1 hypothetical protein BDQ94DRAFT_136550 [Aspergillus welwitschiae]
MNHDSSHHPVVETTESNPARRLITPSYQQLLSHLLTSFPPQPNSIALTCDAASYCAAPPPAFLAPST